MDMSAPNWEIWRHCAKLTVIEAAALVMNLCPTVMKKIEEEVLWSTSEDLFPLVAGANGLDFEKAAIYKERLHILQRRFDNWIVTSELVAFVISKEWQTEPEFATLGLDSVLRKDESAPVLPPRVEAVIGATSMTDDELAALFDPVRLNTLDKIFSTTTGQWEKWAKHAARNGLIEARSSHGRYNPYHAAIWFLKQGPSGWDWPKCRNTLVRNLPPRSAHLAHMLISEHERSTIFSPLTEPAS